MAARDLGRVDWMSRLGKWRVYKYVDKKDVAIGDFDTKSEAEDALRRYVDQQTKSGEGIMANEIEARTDTVFNNWDSLPTEEAKRKALAEALVEVEQIPCTAGLLDALEKAANNERQRAKLTRKT